MISQEDFDYQSELRIDCDNLDVEFLLQSQLFMKYAEACADARFVMDKAKEVLDIVKAEIDADIRSNPGKYDIGDKKITETFVSGLVLRQERYHETAMRYIEARHEYEILSAAVEAFQQRKSALENLVRLHGQSYFAGPSEPRNLPMEYVKRLTSMKRDISRERIREKLGKEE